MIKALANVGITAYRIWISLSNKMGVIMKRITFVIVTLLCLYLVGCTNNDKTSVSTEEIISTADEDNAVDATLNNSNIGGLTDSTASEAASTEATTEASTDADSDRNIFIRNDE